MGDLSEEQLTTLQMAFDAIDTDNTGAIDSKAIGTILKDCGVRVSEEELEEIVMEVDDDGSGLLEFEEFTQLAAKFLLEEDLVELRKELREAFRIYDKEGVGYITNAVFIEILKELDPKLTQENLDDIIEEIDEDGSGTVDFEEFMQMMTG
ncbi:unnamed protein product [Meganyctiphanes norvegica]|uniref:EF-hand domain-containing protein n=1 Tax=Meganyctiphanes norvegica TaxID=48144 RepID=A0AAV2R196_MEGNR